MTISTLHRVKKIGHVYGVCTFYRVSKLSDELLPTIDEIEQSIASKTFGSQVPHEHCLVAFLIMLRA